METPEKTADSRREKKVSRVMRMFIAGVGIFLITLAWVLLHLPPSPNSNPKDVVKYIASPAFAKMPRKSQEIYLDSFQKKNGDVRKLLSDKNLSMAERRNLRRNTMALHHLEMKQRMAKLFSASKEEREKMLDEMAKEMEKRRQQDMASGRGPGGGRGGPPDSSRMQAMLENSDSTSRAQMHEVMKIMHQRMTPPKQ